MSELLPKKLFSEKLEFIGSISKNGKTVDGLHFVVQYSKIKNTGIIGNIIGTTHNYYDLKKIAYLPGLYCELNFETNGTRRQYIKSKKVLIESLHGKPAESNELKYIIADLKFEDITDITELKGNNGSERNLTFFLNGPTKIWEIRYARGAFFDGSVKMDVYNSKLDLGLDLPYEIEVMPWYFYDKVQEPNEYETTTNIYALNLRTKKSIKELSDANFVKSGEKIVEDILLLISFLSRSWVVWYRHTLVTKDVVRIYTKESRKCSSREPQDLDRLIQHGKTREFLKLAVNSLQKLRVNGLDITTSIIYYLSVNEAKYLENKFSILFLSLERIKDIYSIKENLSRNISSSKFKKIKSLLSKIITDKSSSSDVACKMKDKLPELNRPSLRNVLGSLFKRYSITWKDIYPSGNDFTLVKTRDVLFHSSTGINEDLLFKEYYRLRIIIDRLLLRILDWPDLSLVPSSYIKKWLIESMESKNK